jgi:histidinol dehydrogenase
MTQQEESQGAGQRTAEFVAEGRQRIEDFAGAQAQFWDRVQDSNRKWLARFQTEATITADFANKLTSAKSFTDAVNLLQNWTVKHLELATEDARRLLSDTQEIVAAGSRFWTDLGAGNGKSRAH